MSKTIGNGADAREAYLYAYGASQVNVQEIGSGESRTVMLIGGVVYKVGRDSANRWEHECLTEWRKAGAQWAPQTTIYVGRDPEGGDEYTVLAMPYLPDDGGPVDQDTLAAIRVAAPQTCSENYVSHRGKTYLIDGGDIQSSPPDTAAR